MPLSRLGEHIVYEVVGTGVRRGVILTGQQVEIARHRVDSIPDSCNAGSYPLDRHCPYTGLTAPGQ